MVSGGDVLHAEVNGSGPRIVLVHGFTQNSRCWGPVAADLLGDHEVVALDAPGHGRSSPATPDFLAGARAIGDVGRTATYLGYSMGGRYCLALALERPELVERLVLIGANPGLSTAAARVERQRADEDLAAHLETVGVERFITEWLAQPLFSRLDDAAACLPARLANNAAGLASSLRHAGTGAQPDLWPRLAELAMPVLVVTGSEDDKFQAIAQQMVRAIGPNATHVVIPDAGHAAHLEQPSAFLDALRRWLSRTR